MNCNHVFTLSFVLSFLRRRTLILFVLMFTLSSCASFCKNSNDESELLPPQLRVPPVADEYFVSPQGADEYPGTREQPFRSIYYALKLMKPGKTVTLLAGTYNLSGLIKVNVHGEEGKWITIRGDEGAAVILDGDKANIGSGSGYPNNNGLIQVEDASYIRIQNVTVLNSHRSGINIQDSHHIDVIGCTTQNSLSPGIAAWQRCEYIRVLGNTVINANNKEMSWTTFTGSEAPHEAISMAGPHHFEVAWNHVYDCKKEGIDVKETASFGIVHHNYIHDNARQGLYIDGWFGELKDIEMFNNVVHGCEAGIAVSSEEGPNTKNLRIHHNLIYNNRATGIFFSRWGADNPREDVQVYNNTFYRNGWGHDFQGDPQYWLNGGCYLYSANLNNVIIRNNIFAKNMPFEIGYSERYKDSLLEKQQIIIDYNLIQDINENKYSFYLETWAKDWVYVTTGKNAIESDPLFVDPDSGDFRLQNSSPAVDQGFPCQYYNDTDNSRNDIGAFPLGTTIDEFWWKTNFPPVININDL